MNRRNFVRSAGGAAAGVTLPGRTFAQSSTEAGGAWRSGLDCLDPDTFKYQIAAREV